MLDNSISAGSIDTLLRQRTYEVVDILQSTSTSFVTFWKTIISKCTPVMHPYRFEKSKIETPKPFVGIFKHSASKNINATNKLTITSRSTSRIISVDFLPLSKVLTPKTDDEHRTYAFESPTISISRNFGLQSDQKSEICHSFLPKPYN